MDSKFKTLTDCILSNENVLIFNQVQNNKYIVGRHQMMIEQSSNFKLKLLLIRDYVTSFIRSLFYRRYFKNIEKYAMFFGYPRSGHSIFGSMLDAHHNMIISHEQNILLYLKAKFSKNQIFSLILQNSKDFTKSGRKWEEYQYEIPNQWQGKFDKLKVIGDKKGGVSSIMVLNDPSLINKLQKKIKTKLVFLHIIRNPYDNISTMSRKHEVELESSIKSYFRRAEAVKMVKEKFPNIPMLEIRHEQLISDPKSVLKTMCEFLDLDYTQEYLDDCASIVMEQPSKTRYKIEWSKENIDKVKEMMGQYELLAGYTYDD